MSKKFVKINGKYLIEEFDTAQCHIEICWCGFAYNSEDIYAIISKHNANGIENIRFGNEMQIKSMKRSYYFKNLKNHQKW